MVTKSPLSFSWKDFIVNRIRKDLTSFDGRGERGACEVRRGVCHETKEAVEVLALDDEAIVDRENDNPILIKVAD